MRLLRHASCSIAIALFAAAASAQQQSPPLVEETPAPAAAPPVAAPPPEPAPAPTPPPAAEAAAPSAPLFRPYAIIKPTFIAGSKAVESFSQPNASGMTAAGNPVLASLANGKSGSFTTFQAAQSRLGFWFDEKGPVKGHLEFDFLDFTKSSPTTASLPRLRIASLDWALSKTFTISAGQDWDLYSPINPYTTDIPAVAFEASNSGFMRQQAKFIYHNDSVELAAALGLAGVNNGAKFNAVEYSRLPSLALRAALLFGKAGRVGVSAIGSRWRFAPGAANERTATIGAVNIYGDVTPFERFNVRFEGYLGKDLATLGALTLANGTVANDLNEAGGFISAKYGFTDEHALYLTAGTAKVLNDGKVLPSYTYAATADGSTPAFTSAAPTAGVPGIIANTNLRLGYEYRYSKLLALQIEGVYFHTHHKLNDVDVTRFDGVQEAVAGEIGLLYTF
jgi:hypothetical protein